MAACNTGLNSPQGRHHVPPLWFWLSCHFMLLPLSSNKAWAFNFISCKIPDKPAIQAKRMLFCDFFPWVTKRRMMMPWGTWKVLSKLGLFHIFVSPGPRHGQVKNWYGASGLFSILALCSCTRRYGANWFLSIYFQPETEEYLEMHLQNKWGYEN